MIAWALAPLENPTGLSRPAWGDASSWQGKVNAEVLRQNGFYGMAYRATISYGYRDAWFAENYRDAKDNFLYRTGYHVIYPGVDIIRQLDNFYYVMPERDVIPRVIDLEVNPMGVSYRKIADDTWAMCERINARDGLMPIIYSRTSLINPWLAAFWSEEQMNSVWWWLAQYLWDRTREHPGPPTIPNKVREERVVMHQTADKKPAPTGATYSGTLDWDRWELGNSDQMHAWIQQNWGEGVTPPEPCPNPDYISYVKRVKVTAHVLNVRQMPSAESADLGEVLGGTIMPVTKVEGDWEKVEGWIHSNYTTEV